MHIKVLGTGCPKCIATEERVTEVAAAHNIDIKLEKITDINDIMSYGVMMTPALVVDGEVKISGKIPSKEQILSWIQ